MKRRELELLLQQFVDGRLDDEAGAEVVALLKSDPEAFAHYCEYAELDSNLRHLISGPAHLGAEQTRFAELARNQRLKRTRTVSILTAAAAVLIAAVVSYLILLPDKTPILTFRTGPDTFISVEHPADSDSPPAPSTLAPGSRLLVQQGTVECTFASGVRVIVQAPADLTLRSDSLLQVDNGLAWFHVPSGATGFQVETPELLVTDLGTEFGVISHPEARDEVHVFTGKVEALARNGEAVEELLAAGTARSVSLEGELSGIDPTPGLFLDTLPTKPPLHLHWAFDEGDPGRQSVRDNQGGMKQVTSRVAKLEGRAPAEGFSVIQGKFDNALFSRRPDEFVKTDWRGIEAGKPFTVAYWIKLSPGQKHIEVAGWKAPAPESEQFLASIRNLGTSAITGITLGSTGLCGTTPLDDGQWHHVAIVSTGRTNDKGGPAVSCYLDGRPESLERLKHAADLPALPNPLIADGEVRYSSTTPMRVLDWTWDPDPLNNQIVLTLVRENGVNCTYLNGRLIGSNELSPRSTLPPSTLFIGANRAGDGGVEGHFTGTIDRVRLSTFKGSLALSGNGKRQPPEVTVVADYTFDDHRTPPGFVEIGNPTYENGRLVLDGDDALELKQSPLTATDNFIMEVKGTMTALPTMSKYGEFAFLTSNGNGRNSGWGLLYQYGWGGRVMNLAMMGPARNKSDWLPLGIDELHIFGSALREDQIFNLYRHNDILPVAR